MHESLSANLMLAAALLSSLAGMAWLALSMQVHALQVWPRQPSPATLRLLRILGSFSVCVALVLCLAVDHATMAVLVWVMALSAAAMLVAFTLSSQPQRLRVFAPWIR
ncbi:MAG: DUF3325 domain-containing protein [Stenotrophomonas sp.]|jgi:hypothetical protein|uniref:DUF3325 domain-containing protein n=1 Tax=Stenotrophomonas sp. PS02298 TaxID=2991424 RepID=UPI000DB7AB9A|nr:DUF3325 domain-containing protein [Stenotrophomonas sp. PS02298]PZU28690.1 MAG: DUF3325 domain-containing protein [Stenotrophomonas sp.]